MKKPHIILSVILLVLFLGGIGPVIADRNSKGSRAGVPVAANLGYKAEPAVLRGDKHFYKWTAKKSIPNPDPIFTLKPPVSAVKQSTEEYKQYRKRRVASLVKSLEAIEDLELRKVRDRRIRMTDARAKKIADAALYAEEKLGVDAEFMIALARMESDFRGLILINPDCKYRRRSSRCYADCGMTQHHVRGNYRYVMRQCKRLAVDHRYSFFKSAEEIAHHVKWCTNPKHARFHRPLRRCILNRYNMGPFYKTVKNCKRRHNCSRRLYRNETWTELYKWKQECKKREKKCIYRSAYWKKLTCFEYGARHKVRSKKRCRWCYSINEISWRYYPALKPAAPAPEKGSVAHTAPASPK